MNPAGQLMEGVFSIVGALVGIALIALLVRNSSNTSQIIASGSNALNTTFNTLIGGGNYGMGSGYVSGYGN